MAQLKELKMPKYFQFHVMIYDLGCGQIVVENGGSLCGAEDSGKSKLYP